MKDIGCAILAGGRSSRFGQDKATIRIDGKTLVGRVYDAASLVFTDVVVVSSRHRELKDVPAPILRDALPCPGAMTGIITALLHSRTEYTFVVACDMPLVSADVIAYMAGELSEEDIVIPRTRWGYEPLHAIYSRACLAPLLALVRKGRFKITDVLPFVSVKELREEERFIRNGRLIFTNVNTLNDLELMQGTR
ncbi:MAG TPA: molybdenum cofactor guanylyltransferase [Syntrophorhabdaceae bacterium]|nr:molybdenum cofactor guanylyltransferase [Syntrophorhabdaceae bacterium]